ncbi:MAG: hypothetical protein KQH83_09240 [Actinobacteria bacterium]|nr:hypothetical protein [Actinomycetota bacterium]
MPTRDEGNLTDTGGVSDSDRYRELWAYLRHIEVTRFQMTTVVSLSVAGVLGALYGGGAWTDSGGLTVEQGTAIVVALEWFVGFAALYLVAHKKNYSWYLDRLVELDRSTFEKMPKEGTEPSMKDSMEVFAWMLMMLTLLQAALVWSAFALSECDALSYVALVVGLVVSLSVWVPYCRNRDCWKRLTRKSEG